jgi:hypothetical protein
MIPWNKIIDEFTDLHISRSQKWKLRNPEKIEEYSKNYYWANPEKARERVRESYLENPEPRREYSKNYRLEHPEEISQYNKQWKLEHPNYAKEWKLNNLDKIKQYDKEQRIIHSDKIKAIKAKRRRLGFNILWKPEVVIEPMEYHHIDKNNVMLIPEKLHKSIWHNVFTGQGMTEINDLAIFYYFKEIGVI